MVSILKCLIILAFHAYVTQVAQASTWIGLAQLIP